MRKIFWSYWVHSFEMTSNFRISKNLEDSSSNFPNFRKALFQFRILLWKVHKTIFRCLYFWGKVRIAFAIDEFSSVIWLDNAHFPQKLQASKYWFLQCSNILIGKFEIGRGLFENFGKLEDGVSKFSNIPIFGRHQMNEPTVLLHFNNPLHFNRIPSQSFIKDSLDDIFEKGTTNHKGYYATLVKTIKNIIPVPL